MQHVLGGTIYQQTRKIMESNVVDEKVTTAEISRDIQFEWTETPQPLKDIIETSGDLPCIVKMWQEKSEDVKSVQQQLDIHKPLLLYKETKSVKIYCKNVTSVDLLTGAQCREDPIVVVPLGYKGECDKTGSTILGCPIVVVPLGYKGECDTTGSPRIGYPIVVQTFYTYTNRHTL